MRPYHRHTAGFNIIQLLVTIAVIGILSSIILADLSSGRGRARDARRIAELRTFKEALDAYYIQYKVYPCGEENDPTVSIDTDNDGTWDDSINCPASPTADVEGFLNGPNRTSNPTNCTGAVFQLGLFGDGLLGTSCPRDPVNDNSNFPKLKYQYHVTADRQTYILATHLEEGGSRMREDGGVCDDVHETGNGVGILTPGSDSDIGLDNGC